MLTHLSEEALILLYYNEPEISAEQRAHLAGCVECTLELNRLRTVLRLADEFAVPEPPPGFERALWARIAPALEPKRRWFQLPRLWVPAIAMAALLVGAFFLGRTTQSRPETPMAGLSAKARERILVISLADHLERAGMLLTNVENNGDWDRDRAKDLVSEGRLMRQALNHSGHLEGSALLDDVENVLLEVANTPNQVNAAAIHDLQQRIGSDSLLFKVRVVETNLRTKGQRL